MKNIPNNRSETDNWAHAAPYPHTTQSESPESGELPMLPCITFAPPKNDTSLLTRREFLSQKRFLEQERQGIFRQTQGKPGSPQRDALYREIRAFAEEAAHLETRLAQEFIPQHSAAQFLSPRSFFTSPLFSARNKSLPRLAHTEFDLPAQFDKATIRYSGPELRQSDSRVFLSLLNMLRDVRVGTCATFSPELLCIALLGRYDGNARAALKLHIQRLQKALIVTVSISVQLCQEFCYPPRGGWSVVLHPHIVELFHATNPVWLQMKTRLGLPDGLASWLYTYIESQRSLIPTPISLLRVLCGSDADSRAFTNSLRLALREIAALGIIDGGWSVRNGEVRWLKRKRH